jgi:hypothetical protein
MKPQSYYPDLKIPFRHLERNGHVQVSCSSIEDPVRTGFDSMAGIKFDINLSRGYPMMHVQIEDFEGFGYRTFFGWIQLITRKEYDSYEDHAEPVVRSMSVDLPPSMQNLDLPFAAYGYFPQFFDAPCLNLYHHIKLEWVADTFLTTVPGRSRNEEITRLLGFRWGYIEYHTNENKPVILPVEATGEAVWNAHLTFLSSRFPDWRFRKVEFV